jgi:hypothetical protein
LCPLETTHRSFNVSAWTEKLSNADVRWEGTALGLAPELTGEAARVVQLGDQALPGLLEALSDPDRFVVAHVALTELLGVEYESFPTWNGLEVSLEADGTVRIDPAQRPALAQRWQRWYTARPRPTALPPVE